MGKTCAVVDCEKKDVALFQCPKNERQAGLWKCFLQVANKEYEGFIKPNKITFICSDHFTPASVDILPSLKSRVIKNAVPTLKNGKCIITPKELETMYESKDATSIENGSVSLEKECTCGMASKIQEQHAIIADLTEKIQQKDYQIQKLMENVAASQNTINRLSADVAAKKASIVDYQKRLYVYVKKENRQETSKKRKKEFTAEPAKRPHLSTSRLSEASIQILDELKDKSMRAKNSEFSESLKEFAYELHYYSPRAYERLRMTIPTFPFPTSFRRWTKHVTTTPGFIPVALEFLQKIVSDSPYRMHAAVMIDEVHIRKQVIPDCKGGFIGYEDYGNLASPSFSKKEASAALFVMANIINGAHKIPLGYILTNGVNKITISQVLKNSIERLEDLGVNVTSVTFDGLPANIKAAEQLGANLDVRSPNFNPLFKSGRGNDINVILDPSHMLKLMRNLFKEYKVLVNENGEEIKWEYIEKLQALQDAEGLRAANKITIRHVNYQNQKMKTGLAAQTLSGSAAIAIHFARDTGIDGFQNSSATEEFLHLMNKLFDYLNSTRTGTGARAPLRWTKYSEVTGFFSMCTNYLLHLKRRLVSRNKVVDTLLMDTPRKTGVLGLIVAMRSVETIMKRLLADPASDLKYIPTVKISQDPLENFFSSLRARYGFNNNPNALQLQHGVKSLICMKTKAIQSGNCEEQEELSTKLSPLGNFNNIVEDNPDLEADIDDEHFEIEDLSNFVSNIVMYIAGFVATKLIKKLSCSNCVLKLYATEKDIPKMDRELKLTNFRNRGGLFISSYPLFCVCKITEQFVRAENKNGLTKMKKENIVRLVSHECLERGITKSIECENGNGVCNFESSHSVQLVKQIALLYSNTRFNYIAKQETLRLKPTTNRNVSSSNVKFTGN